MENDVTEHNRRVASYHEALEGALASLTDGLRSAIIAEWRGGSRGDGFGLSVIRLLGTQAVPEEFVGMFGSAVARHSFQAAGESDPELCPQPDEGEERVVMGEFDGAMLYYVPGRHRYRVELGVLHEEFAATWEPVFGMDVADVQMAEEALDRLLALTSR